MMSGMRKAPPISTNSPRDTTTSRRLAKPLSISKTAAALLLTTVAASAPVSSHNKSSTRSSRSPRRPVARSNSRLAGADSARSEEHTSELQSLMRISYAVFCLKKKKKNQEQHDTHKYHSK